MKRVLFFNYEYPPLGGGAANATAQLLRAYSARGDIKVDLITSAIGDHYECFRPFDNITVHRLPIGKNRDNLNYQSMRELVTYSWKAFRFAQELIDKKHYDLTHSFFGIPCGVISLVIKIFYKIPYIVSLRGADVPGYSERFVWIYRLLSPLIHQVWKRAQHVVTNSEGLTELARKSRPQQRFKEIYNGIDADFYTPGKRTALDRATSFHILCASRLSHRKGFHWALDAFALIADTYPHAHLTIAGGDGGVESKLKGQAQALSIQDRVTFLGHYSKEKAPHIYQDADVFLMPSLNEGMSNNVLEALASGLPVLMTDTGGAKELIDDGINGYLIAMHSDADIAEKLAMMIDAPEAMDRMGQESRAKALTLTWSAVGDQYAALYNTVK